MRNWFFFNSKSGSQTELDENELGRYLREISEEGMPYTFVWKSGWKHWVPVSKVPELISMRYMTPPPPPQLGTRYPPENRSEEVDGLEANQKLTPDQEDDPMFERFRTGPRPVLTPATAKSNPNLEKIGRQERRSSKRFEGRLKVMVKCGEQVFRTYTTNASTKGVMLEHAIPASMMDTEIEIYIYSPDNQSCLRLNARLIEDQKDSKRLKFISSNDLTERRLYSWISTLSSESQKAAIRRK